MTNNCIKYSFVSALNLLGTVSMSYYTQMTTDSKQNVGRSFFLQRQLSQNFSKIKEAGDMEAVTIAEAKQTKKRKISFLRLQCEHP